MAYGNKKMTPAKPAVKKTPVAKKKPVGGKIPKGMHRMPDGSLMKNSAHKKRR